MRSQAMQDYADFVSRDGDVSKCPYLEQERFADTKAEIVEFLSTHRVVEEKIGKDKVEDIPLQCKGCEESIIGVIDRRRADFSLGRFLESLPAVRTYFHSVGLST